MKTLQELNDSGLAWLHGFYLSRREHAVLMAGANEAAIARVHAELARRAAESESDASDARVRVQ